jgi:hypothetical protein
MVSLTGVEFHDFGKSNVVAVATDQVCFYCGRPCYDPGWTWSGETNGNIYMHVSCALNFAIRINRDVWEYQKQTGIKATTTE